MTSATQGPIVIQGIPFDDQSSFLKGPALAPGRIREAFFSNASNLHTENNLDLSTSYTWQFASDCDFSSSSGPFDLITQTIASHVADGYRVISLGGDHSITYPIMRGYASAFPELTILQLDAHSDLYDEFEGNRYSHACPFARIMEENLAGRLVQMGIRATTQHQREQADRFGVEIHEMKDWTIDQVITLKGPIYISLDLDCLDPAYAPGVSHHEPGGFTSRDVISIIQQIEGPIVGADIVELNPTRDWMDMTAVVAAKCLKEILGRMLN